MQPSPAGPAVRSMIHPACLGSVVFFSSRRPACLGSVVFFSSRCSDFRLLDLSVIHESLRLRLRHPARSSEVFFIKCISYVADVKRERLRVMTLRHLAIYVCILHRTDFKKQLICKNFLSAVHDALRTQGNSTASTQLLRFLGSHFYQELLITFIHSLDTVVVN